VPYHGVVDLHKKVRLLNDGMRDKRAALPSSGRVRCWSCTHVTGKRSRNGLHRRRHYHPSTITMMMMMMMSLTKPKFVQAANALQCAVVFSCTWKSCGRAAAVVGSTSCVRTA